MQVLNGRGDVDVIQQPSAQNNYTTIVRIQDPRSGSDNYRLAAYWQAYSNGDVYGRDRNCRRAAIATTIGDSSRRDATGSRRQLRAERRLLYGRRSTPTTR